MSTNARHVFSGGLFIFNRSTSRIFPYQKIFNIAVFIRLVGREPVGPSKELFADCILKIFRKSHYWIDGAFRTEKSYSVILAFLFDLMRASADETSSWIEYCKNVASFASWNFVGWLCLKIIVNFCMIYRNRPAWRADCRKFPLVVLDLKLSVLLCHRHHGHLDLNGQTSWSSGRDPCTLVGSRSKGFLRQGRWIGFGAGNWQIEVRKK